MSQTAKKLTAIHLCSQILKSVCNKNVAKIMTKTPVEQNARSKNSNDTFERR